MTYTKVFATAEEIAALKAPHPYMVIGTRVDKEAPGGFSPNVTESVLEHCHRLALRHGLPEIDGYYGCDLSTGEFVKC